jgi:hypothetical protein
MGDDAFINNDVAAQFAESENSQVFFDVRRVCRKTFEQI